MLPFLGYHFFLFFFFVCVCLWHFVPFIRVKTLHFSSQCKVLLNCIDWHTLKHTQIHTCTQQRYFESAICDRANTDWSSCRCLSCWSILNYSHDSSSGSLPFNPTLLITFFKEKQTIMQRSSLLLFMEEYLWEEEWGQREVNKCSYFSFLRDKWIDKQMPSSNLAAWQQAQSQKALQHQWIFVSVPWLDGSCAPVWPRGTIGRGTAGISARSIGAVFNGCCCFLLVHNSVEWIRFVASAAHRSSMNKYYSIYLWRIDLPWRSDSSADYVQRAVCEPRECALPLLYSKGER